MKEQLTDQRKRQQAKENKVGTNKGEQKYKKLKRKANKGKACRLKKYLASDLESSVSVNVDISRLCDDDNGIEELCCICDEFGRDGETWYRYTNYCGNWAHKEYSGRKSPIGQVCDNFLP